MNCPQCKEQMKQSSLDEITLTECPRCRGMWFDHGQLDAAKDRVLPDMGWLDIDTWKEQAEFEASIDRIFCPKCRNIALTIIHDRKSMTEISMCMQCKGTWLATGQFLNLINALLDEANQKSAPEFVKISLHQAKDMLTNPDVFLSEWHDLKTVLGLLSHRIFIEHPKLNSVIVGLQKSLPL
ncbi:MAG: zf-TFIIB domain-containing protein [Desulfobacterales bacterium]